MSDIVKNEIIRALQELGYHDVRGRIRRVAPDRYEVSLNGKYFGIYDMDKHNFVD